MHGTHSGKSTINPDVPLSPNQLSYGPLRKSATSHNAQECDDLWRRPHTLQQYTSPDGTLDRHLTKSVVYHDDNVQKTLDKVQIKQVMYHQPMMYDMMLVEFRM